jgi:uncharacterized membrane protein YkoI
MKNNEMESKIKKAFTQETPDVLDSVLSDCKAQKGKVIVMERKIKMSRWAKRTVAVAAVFLLMIGSVFGYRIYDTNYAVASTVSLDVNPSIEVLVNQKEKVLSVNPINEDGKIVVGDMKFAGNSLDVTINALIESMLRNGYLDELANSILVSVDNEDPQKGVQLQNKLTEEINSLLKTGSFEGAVLSQVVSSDDSLKKIADQYGITPGKAQLIRKIISQNSLYTFEMLVPLSINELNLLIGSSSLDEVEAIGTASDKAYIGLDKAKEIALNHAGVTASAAINMKAELDYENGKMVYEIEFDSNQYEYDYDIDAVTGTVIKHEKEQTDDENKATSAGSSQTYIGEQKAKELALKHAGVSADKISNYKIELDTDDGVAAYEIEFQVRLAEYDYKINAVTGAVLKSEKEIDDDDAKEENAAPTASATNIGEAKAKEAALKHAGVSADKISNYKINLDQDDGTAIYEIEFKVDQTEYDYEINAVSGAVVKGEKEIGD